MNKKTERPKIRHMAHLVSLLESGKRKLTIEQRLKLVKEAGFDGFTGRVPMITREHVEKSGLLFAATVDIGGIPEIKSKLRAIKAVGTRCVNVQMLDHDTPTKRAIEVGRRVMAASEELEMDVSIEVHRDTCTETPEKAYALAKGYEKAEGRLLKMTWDFSHPAVIKHLRPPYWDRLAERPDLIQLANQFHFRPFNGHHAQIPALGKGGKFTPEFVDWLEFSEKVIQCWLQTATAGREMIVCPEQIAGGYFLSVFGDRWKDVKAIRKAVDRVWKKNVKRWKPPRRR